MKEMALSNIKVKFNQEMESERKTFGSAFFDLYNYFQSHEEYSPLKVLEIKPILEEISKINQRKKQCLCESLLRLDDIQGYQLNSIIEAEVHYQHLINALQILEKGDKAYRSNRSASTFVYHFFWNLHLFLLKSTNHLKEFERVEEQLKNYFLTLANNLKANREIYANKLVTKRTSKNSEGRKTAVNPLQDYEYEDQLDLLRNVKLIDRVIETLMENGKKASYFTTGILGDEKLQYYLFKELEV